MTFKWNLFSGPSSWCYLCSILLVETWRFSLTLILSTNISIKFKSPDHYYQTFGTNIVSFILETITAKFCGMFFCFCLFVCFSNIASHSSSVITYCSSCENVFLFNKRYKICDVDNLSSTLFSIYPTGRQHSPLHRHAKEFQGLGFVDLRKCQLRSNWKTSKGLLVYSVFLFGKVRAIFT